jgi:hypothetical protein
LSTTTHSANEDNAALHERHKSPVGFCGSSELATPTREARLRGALRGSATSRVAKRQSFTEEEVMRRTKQMLVVLGLTEH